MIQIYRYYFDHFLALESLKLGLIWVLYVWHPNPLLRNVVADLSDLLNKNSDTKISEDTYLQIAFKMKWCEMKEQNVHNFDDNLPLQSQNYIEITYFSDKLFFIIMSLKLASGSYDGTIRFWDPSTGNCIKKETIDLNQQFKAVPNRIQISENKKNLLIGMNSSVKIFDLEKNTPSISFDNSFKGNVTSIGFSDHDKQIYAAGQDGNIKLFDINSKNCVKTFKHNKPVSCAVMWQKQIIAGDEAGSLRVVDIAQEKLKLKYDQQEQKPPIRSITVTQKGDYAFAANNIGQLKRYYIGQGSSGYFTFNPIQAHKDYILKVELSSNNKFLATCSADKRVKLYKVLQGQQLKLEEYKVLKGHSKWVWDCRFSCDSAYLITCSTDTTIKLWDVAKAQMIQTLKGHEKGVTCLAINDTAQFY